MSQFCAERRLERLYAIETIELTKKYIPPQGFKALLIKSPLKKEITAVDGINLQVKKGEIFGLIGPNGAGKTTLIKMLSTLLWPTSGEAFVNGYNLLTQENQVKGSIALVTGEERSFYLRLTGRQNLKFFSALYGLTPQNSEKRINILLDQLGLAKASDNMFYSYSSGMKQKLTLARGLLCNPTVLFLDEPTKSVDVLTARELRGFIKENLVEEDKRTVFLTTHRLEEAEMLCDRLAIINNGRISFCGTINELRKIMFTKTKEKFVLLVKGISHQNLNQIFLHQNLEALNIEVANLSESELKIEFSNSNGHNPLSQMIENIFANGGTLLACNKVEPRLEEIFVSYIEEQKNVVS